ncbi:MAG: hypothetical protein V1750_04830 [Acidobacteriota bacterium]
MSRNRLVKLIRIGGVVAVVALALLLGLRVQARAEERSLENEFREKVGPLDPAAYASPVVPDGENAAIWLRAAAAALVLEKADKDLVAEMTSLPADAWTADQRAAIGRLFSRIAPALDLAERASTKRLSSYLLSGTQATSVKPDIPVLELLWLARLIREHALFALESGDSAAYRLDVSRLACIAASLERETPLIAQLIGLAAERMMADVILAGVRAPAIERAALDHLDAVIPDVDLATAWRRALGGLGAGVHSGGVDLRNMFDAASTKVVMSVPSPEEYLRIVLGVAGLASRPMGLDGALADRLEKSKQLEKGRPTADTLAGSLVRYQSILSLRRLARLAIAVRLEALDTGRYPDTLAAWPEASAPDPFTGGSLRYERRADGSAAISVPGAEDLYNRINELKTFVPYTWELPAPRPAASTVKR